MADIVEGGPYREPGEVISDDERYRRAHTAYWAMMAMDQKAYSSLPAADQAKFNAESQRLRHIMIELAAKLHR